MINCFEYCMNRVKFGEDLQDPMVAMAADIENMEEQITELRTQRWQLATLSLNRASNVVIEVLDKTAFKASIDRENELLAAINRNRALFARLSPVFAKAGDALVRFAKPTLEELKVYKQDVENKAFLMDRQVKQETAFRITSDRNKGKSFDEILQSDDFLQYKQGMESTIKNLEEEGRVAGEFITQLEEIMKNN